MKLRLASNLSLPLEAVTQSIGILAKRRAGKSYTARRLVEQLLKAGQQVVIVDPKGDWWGIRSSADGKAPGLPVIILGGEHGDVDLEPGAGELIAKLVVEERVNLLLDLSGFRKSEVAYFMGGPNPPRGRQEGFLESLYRLKAKEQFRTPMMLAMDESDAIAPQKPQKGEERMLGAAEDIVRRGGQRGIGCMMITQRSAVLNKNVLTQVQVLIALRTIAPQDLQALNAWIDVHGTEEERKTLMASLPSLPTGEAWIWSPGWPTTEGIFQRVKVLPIETFDSGATPEPGKKPIEPKNLADVDLEALKRQMAVTIERAKQNDPRALQAEITRLRSELARKSQVIIPQAKVERIEVSVLKDGQIARLERIASQFATAVEHLGPRFNQVVAQAEAGRKEIRDLIGTVSRITKNPTTSVASAMPVLGPQAIKAPPVRVAHRSAVVDGSQDDERLEKAERKILTALAQYPEGRTKSQVAVLTGYAVNGGGFNNALSALRSRGYAAGTDPLRITEAGLRTLGPFDPLPVPGPELREHWMGQLGAAEQAILHVLTTVWPQALNKEEIAAQTISPRGTPYAPDGGGFNNAISRLRTLELISGRGDLKANDDLMGGA